VTCRSALVVALAATVCVASAAQDRPAWLCNGAIYETHPCYYDGTFKGLTKQIPSIAELGVKTIYLMPIWEHKKVKVAHKGIYLIHDYYKIDPAYGTPEDLKQLVETVHKHGMRILFDLVTTATPPGSVIYDKWTFRMPLKEAQERAAKLGWELKYETREGRKFVSYGEKTKTDGRRSATLHKFAAEIVGDDAVAMCSPKSNWGPAVDRSRPEAINYFAGVAAHYVKEFDIDGWRIDAPGDNWNREMFPGDRSSEKLLLAVKEAVRKVKPDASFLSEGGLKKGVYANAAYIHPAAFAALFQEADRTSAALVSEFDRRLRPSDPLPAYVPECHDSARLASEDPSLARPFLVLMSTLPGIPFIQAGQEIGARNAFWSSNPRVDWDKPDPGIRDFSRAVLSLRALNPALREGNLINVWKAGDNVFAYLRRHKEEIAVVVVNLRPKPAACTVNLPLKRGDVLFDALTDGETFSITDTENVEIAVPACGSRILLIKGAEK